MAIYKIVTKEDPVLRRTAKPVANVDERIQKLMDNMAETMYQAKGVGLAAPQVGISKRVIVVDIGDHLYAIANPEIVEHSGISEGPEGCLSCPGMAGQVRRAHRILLEGINRSGERVSIPAEGYLARAFQHELDHLNGVLFIDKATEIEYDE